MTYTFEISTMICKKSDNGLTNVVDRVGYTLLVTETINGTQYILTHEGTAIMEPPAPESFIAYENLTQPQVENWLSTKVNVMDIANKLITRKTVMLANAEANPYANLGLPW